MSARKPPQCPACDCYCVVDFNTDYMECPFHGKIPGILAFQLQGANKINALVEIRASQALDEIRRMACFSTIKNNNKYRNWDFWRLQYDPTD